MWEGRRLRDVTEADVRQLLNSGLEEHLLLEYKQQAYGNSHADRRELLLDICQFANTQGGVLLIGIAESSPGVPDPSASLGIQVADPEQLLLDYDARVLSCIQDRLPIESFPIPIAGGTYVLAIRVPDSVNKPHCVTLEGHIYFSARRERSRYPMDIREIKEMAMRTASSLERAETILDSVLKSFPLQHGLGAQLLVGVIPVFWKEFSVDIRNTEILQAVRTFTPGAQVNPVMSFTGLDRIVHNDGSKVHVRRNGLIAENRRLAGVTTPDDPRRYFFAEAIDDILHAFVAGTSRVYQAAGIGGPFLLTMILRFQEQLSGAYPEGNIPGAIVFGHAIAEGIYPFPNMQATDLTDIDKMIRPLCDQAHQMSGRDGSGRFDQNGRYISRL